MYLATFRLEEIGATADKVRVGWALEGQQQAPEVTVTVVLLLLLGQGHA
jgi:hypothetical protein